MICIFSGIICYIFFLIFNIFFRPGQDHLLPAVATRNRCSHAALAQTKQTRDYGT